VIVVRRLMLLATPREVGVLDLGPGRLRWLGGFEPQELDAFRQLVQRYSRLPVLIVVDTVDEDYRSEILPHARGAERSEMLARRLRQVFRNARFTGGWRQTRETTGRRDDRYLLAALTDVEWLRPWLRELHAAQAPLAGVVPLALASQPLLRRLKATAPNVLLAYRINSRLRLSYFHHGQLRFSRLVGSDMPTQTPTNAADEIAKTRLYLAAQRVLPRDAHLHVVLLDPSGQLDWAEDALNAEPMFDARLVDLSELAGALRIPADFLAATPEIAPLVAVASEPLRLNLAPAQLLQRHAQMRWRQWLGLAAALAAAGGLVLTGNLRLQAQALRMQALEIQAQTQRIEARHAARVRDFPALATRPDQLGETLALAQKLSRPPFDVAALLAPLGQALSQHPDIVVRTLRLEDKGADTARVVLEAHLSQFDGNYRAAVGGIDLFVARLANTPGVRAVTRLASPADTAPGATLSGTTSGGRAPEDTRFSVSVEVGAR
jgi:hypothetical protein